MKLMVWEGEGAGAKKVPMVMYVGMYVSLRLFVCLSLYVCMYVCMYERILCLSFLYRYLSFECFNQKFVLPLLIFVPFRSSKYNYPH